MGAERMPTNNERRTRPPPFPQQQMCHPSPLPIPPMFISIKNSCTRLPCAHSVLFNPVLFTALPPSLFPLPHYFPEPRSHPLPLAPRGAPAPTSATNCADIQFCKHELPKGDQRKNELKHAWCMTRQRWFYPPGTFLTRRTPGTRLLCAAPLLLPPYGSPLNCPLPRRSQCVPRLPSPFSWPCALAVCWGV
jgi:hypothetical protein